MKFYHSILIMFYILIPKIHAQSYFDENFLRLTVELQKEVYNENFANAGKLLKQYRSEGLGQIQLLFLSSVTDFWKGFTDNNQDSFDDFLQTINQLIEKLDVNENNYSILGACYGFKGMYYLEKQEMFSAVKNASKGVDFLTKALKRDSTLFDCYYGLGLYNYNAGKSNFFIRLILPIFFNSANSEDGIKYLELSSLRGHISIVQSLFALAQIYEKEDDHLKSAMYYEKLLREYPHSTVFNALLMQNYYNYQKQYEKTIEFGKKLLDSNSESEFQKKKFGDFIIFLMVKSFERISNYQNALLYAEKYQKYRGSKSYSQEVDELIPYYKSKLNK